VAFPLPPGAEVMVIHAAEGVAVQLQNALVVRANEPLALLAVNDAVAGESV